ncbi:MliC family protein [Otariodibacter sp.]|uniref:MliC family protein n=1 Tax=Otariodibacter sp. TaxID=3030919 RepID=UPI0026266CF2|nr:MliC family protein [Otariodibacter sp.]
MYSLRYKNIWQFLCCMSLTACSLTTIAPVEQLQKKIETDQAQIQQTTQIESRRGTVKKQIINLYLCEKEQNLKIQSIPEKSNLISVTFNHITHTLSPTVTSRGKRYSNIRWIWSEDLNGIGTLSDNRNNILAIGCIKKGD